MKCNNCGREVENLFNGVCTSCMSMTALENKMEQIEADNRLEDGAYQNSKLTQPVNGRGYFGSIYYNPELESRVLRKIGGGFPEMSLGEKEESLLEEVLKIGLFDERDKKAYMPSIKTLYRKYMPLLESGKYRMCKKTDYGTRFNGQVIDKHGGILVYKINNEEPEYENFDKVEKGSYVPDDKIICE